MKKLRLLSKRSVVSGCFLPLYMNETDYKAVLNETLRNMVAIREKTERLEIEAAKLRQFFFATLNMLAETDRAQFMEAFRQAGEGLDVRERSLKEAIADILRKSSPKYLTAADVRDRLRANGFDFSGYTSNELASVSTTLRRLKPEEAEMTTIEGVMAWRAKESWIKRARRVDSKWLRTRQGRIFTDQGILIAIYERLEFLLDHSYNLRRDWRKKIAALRENKT